MRKDATDRAASRPGLAMRLCVAVAATAVLGACASTRNYSPAVERPFEEVAANGCGSKGDVVIVTGQVTKAYENTVTLWNGYDAAQTVTVNLPGRGSPVAKMRQWFGTNKYELTADQLNQLSAERRPVTVTMECRGGRVPSVARSIEFDDPQGRRVAIGY